MPKYVYRHVKGKNNKNKPIFEYKLANGTIVDNKNTITHIKSLGCPPAWRNVELNANKNAELACTGIDAGGRKQYLYTKMHNLKKQRNKFCGLIDFGDKLPKIRAKYNKELTGRNKKARMIALIIKIIESCHFRIGTERCRKTYSSYGMTTLFKEHIDVKANGRTIIDFIGKKGVRNLCTIKDPEVGRLLEQIKHAAANKERIFKYVNANKGVSYVSFLDINNYLGEFGNFTSKTFRTWAANKVLLEELDKHPIEVKITKRKKTLRKSIVDISGILHHTPAICKKEYLCKDLLDLYVDEPNKFKKFMKDKNANNVEGLTKYEGILLNFLKKYYKEKNCKDYKNKRTKVNLALESAETPCEKAKAMNMLKKNKSKKVNRKQI